MPAVDSPQEDGLSFAELESLVRPLAADGLALGADVTAGENNGRKLMHDFVVLGLLNEGIKSGAKELNLPAESSPPAANSRSAMAAWVTQSGQIEPIQAVGGWLQ